jgi:hypothetical protein
VLRLLVRRATVQIPLLTAVVIVVTVGVTLLGVCALLLTASQERALEEGMSRAEPSAVEVTAYVTGIPGKHVRSVADDTRSVITQTLQPFRTTITTRASSVMRPLEGSGSGSGPRRVGYLSGVDTLERRARLTAGRWPRAGASTESTGSLETVILESTARALDLKPGSRVRLGAERPTTATTGTVLTPVTVVVVGTFQPLPDAGWDRDPLGSAGFNPAYLDGGPHGVPAYGPFVVDLADLFASGSTMDRLQVNARPDLSAPTGSTLNAAAAALGDADVRLRKLLGDRIDLERIASDLPFTLGLARTQQAVTRATVLIVVLLGTTLTMAALGLAGRLVAALRANETALLSALGASRGQLAATAAAEAVLLATIAAVIAVPLSGLAHSWLTHLPTLADAGLAARPGVTGAQVAAVFGGAALLAAVLFVPALRSEPEQAGTRGTLGALTRSGADLLLLALAAVGWWQLRAQPATDTGTDAIRILAPVLCLLAGAALAPRLVALPLRLGERLAQRARGLVLPLAAFEAARRPQAVAAGLLLSLAAATGTFGLAFGATWELSQLDQADAQVGTDLSLALTAPVAAGQGRAITEASGGTVSPVTDRGVVVGRWVGNAGAPPRLVAIDTTRAGALLQGRLPAGTTWAQVGSKLAPSAPITGVPLPTGDRPRLTVTGTSTFGPRLRAVPRLVLQDADGLRTSCDAPAVILDGHPHPLPLCLPPSEGSRLVAVGLLVDGAAAGEGFENFRESTLTIALRVPPAEAGSEPAWTSAAVGDMPERLGKLTTDVQASSAATVVRITADVKPATLVFPYSGAQIMLTAFKPPAAVPIAVSDQFVETLGASIGQHLTVTLGATPVPVVVAAMVPSVPSAPGEMAMLADVDVLSRVLISTADTQPVIDSWWVGGPTEPDAPAAVTALALGRLDTRTNVSEQLSSGPLRVGLPAALSLLVPAVILLVLAGTVMHVTSDIEARAVEVARLRGLGVPRRSVLVGLLAQHGGVLTLLLSTGAVIGTLASWAVAPLLIRSELGARPVPAALVSWPWSAELGLLAVLLIGGTATVALVVAVQVRRADAAHLRVGA